MASFGDGSGGLRFVRTLSPCLKIHASMCLILAASELDSMLFHECILIEILR